MTEAERARRLVESCQLPGYADPEGHEIYPAIEDGVNSIGNALAAAQVLATLAMATELRRQNDRGDAFNAELLSFFKRLTEEPQPGDVSSLRSEQPAAALACQVCGKPGIEGACVKGPLSGGQWRAHLKAVMAEAPEWAVTDLERHNWAVGPMTARFGPCPEES